MSASPSRMPAFSVKRSTSSWSFAFVLEERLVGADDLGVLLQALADARAQPDDALDAVGRQEGVAEDSSRPSGRCGPRGRRAGSAG